MKYKLLYSTIPEILEEEVNKYIEMGFETSGNTFVSDPNSTIYQVMIENEPNFDVTAPSLSADIF